MIIKFKSFKKSIIKFLQYISCICIFVGTDSMYIALQNGTKVYNISSLLLMLSLVLISLISFPIKRKYLNKVTFISLLIVVFFSIYCFFSDFVTASILILICEIICFLFYVVLYELNNDCMFELLDNYSNLMLFLGILTFFLWLFCSVLHVIPFNRTVISYWSGKANPKVVNSFYNIYFEPVDTNMFGIPRNSGLFTEAALASLSFGISLLNEVFINQKKNYFRIIAFIVIIFSTTSTAGIIIAILVILYLLFKSKFNILILRIIKGLLFPLLIVVTFILIRSLFSFKIATFSGGDRVTDYINGFSYFKKKFVIGYGYGNSGFMNSINSGYSNSITFLMLTGGLFFILPWILLIVKSIYVSYVKKNVNIFLFALFIILIFTMIICADRPLMLYIFVCLLLSENIKLEFPYRFFNYSRI